MKTFVIVDPSGVPVGIGFSEKLAWRSAARGSGLTTSELKEAKYKCIEAKTAF